MQQNAEVEECLKRILSQERVSRYIIFNKDGIVIRNDGWPSEGDGGYAECVQIAANVSQLVKHSANGCRELMLPPNNEIECLRLKTALYEMIVAPAKNFTMVAFQDNAATSNSAISS